MWDSGIHPRAFQSTRSVRSASKDTPVLGIGFSNGKSLPVQTGSSGPLERVLLSQGASVDTCANFYQNKDVTPDILECDNGLLNVPTCHQHSLCLLPGQHHVKKPTKDTSKIHLLPDFNSIHQNFHQPRVQYQPLRTSATKALSPIQDGDRLSLRYTVLAW